MKNDTKESTATGNTSSSDVVLPILTVTSETKKCCGGCNKGKGSCGNKNIK